jgi:hypothetical protein
MNAAEIKALLELEPLPGEGGYYREMYRSHLRVGERSASTAIYYFLTPETFSAMHRLPFDEVFHFYLGDPVEQLQLRADGTAGWHLLGSDLRVDQRPQILVPAGSWQGSRLVSGGGLALMGTTMAPGFEFKDYEAGEAAVLSALWPSHAESIRALTH